MKTAERLAQKHFAVAIMRAAECAIAKDKNRALCMTKYTFDDNSVLAVRGMTMCAFDADSLQSITDYASWLGHDIDDAELNEINRLLEALEN